MIEFDEDDLPGRENMWAAVESALNRAKDHHGKLYIHSKPKVTRAEYLRQWRKAHPGRGAHTMAARRAYHLSLIKVAA